MKLFFLLLIFISFHAFGEITVKNSNCRVNFTRINNLYQSSGYVKIKNKKIKVDGKYYLTKTGKNKNVVLLTQEKTAKFEKRIDFRLSKNNVKAFVFKLYFHNEVIDCLN